MEENENKNEHIDDDILKSREDILRIKKQSESSTEPSGETSPPAQPETSQPVQKNTQDDFTSPGIPSFEDLTARAGNANDDNKPEEDNPPVLPEKEIPTILNEYTADTGNAESDINNDTAHAFAELLSGGPDDDEDDNEDEIQEHHDETDHSDDHDPLAIIGNAVKMAQLENHTEDELPKIEQPPAIAETAHETPHEAPPEATPEAIAESAPENNDSEEIDIIDDDADGDVNDDFEQLERELQELGIASEEDDDPQMLQQTPPEPETDKYHQNLLDSDNDKQPEKLTDEERDDLTSDLTEVKELLDQQDDEDAATEQTVPKFDLADQILAEHRKLASAKRLPPTRKAPTPNIPSASGTVADVIDENKKTHTSDANLEKPVQTEPEKKPEPSTEPVQQVRPAENSVNICSPAVQSIITNGEELTEFQKQIIAELVERDIELHSRETLRKKTQNLRFKK